MPLVTLALVGEGHSAGEFPSDDPAVFPASNEAEICVGCGLPLTRRGVQGECLRCALRVVWQEESQETGGGHESQSPTAVAIAPRLRYGHFEVVRADDRPVELGSGAMATTYRAQDTILQAPVALKVISQSVAGHPDARARFLREARATARLHHPNVASVTFYGEQEGECFYAMELVEGETLAERVRRTGVLSAEQALEVGVQVARALAAAEVHGVVHRDLKPSNLMLVGAPKLETPTTPEVQTAFAKPAEPPLHVKVIDWGLAKVVSAGQETLGAEHTHGGFVGTPAFASPEQFARAGGAGGGGQRLDTRGDIYSLGVTLWYLLCGRVPFVGSTLESIHARQRALPMEQLKAAKVPGSLAQVLKSMVAFDPAGRPQSARELLEVLRHCQDRCREQPPTATHRRRFLQAGVAFVLLALGTGVWWHRRPQAAPPAVSEKPSLAVLPFENLSADEAEAFFAKGMQDEITNSLAWVAQMKVISSNGTRLYEPGKPHDFAAIGRELGVKNLLEGSVRRAGTRMHITVHLVDVDHPSNTWGNAYGGTMQDIFGIQTEITYAVADRLHVVLTPHETVIVNRPLTVDPQAHELYLRATTMQVGIAHPDDVQLELEKASLFDAAVARDPNFADAYRYLVNVHSWLYGSRMLLPPSDRNVDHAALANRALAQARRLEPDDGDTHLAAADYLFLVGHDYEQARIEVDLARRTLPNSTAAEFLTGETAYCQGRWQEAMSAFERSVTLSPMRWGRRFNMADHYRHLRYYEKSDSEMGRALAIMPPENTGIFKAMRALVPVESEADLGPLRDVLARFTPGDDTTGRIKFRDGFILHLFERDAEAAAKSLASYKMDPIISGGRLYPRAWFEAQIAQLRGDDASAKSALAAARTWMEHEVTAHPDDGWRLSMLAVFDAGLGHTTEAVREALRAVDLAPYGLPEDYASTVRGNLALVYAWTGQLELSLDVLESIQDKPNSYALPAQPSYGDLKLNPCWDPLRGDPRFDAIAKRFAQPVPGP